MDFGEFFPRDYLPALTWLGRRDWLLYDADSDYRVNIRPNRVAIRPSDQDLRTWDKSTSAGRGFWEKVDRCVQVAHGDHIKAMWMLTISKLLAYGPKMFCPTPEDCVTAEYMKVGMRFEEYRQPYEAVIIQIPCGYQQELKNRLNLKTTPKYVVPFYNLDKMFISVSAYYAIDNIVANLIPARPEYETLQDCFDMHRDRLSYPGDTLGDREFQAAEIVQKMAINFCLLMTLKGIRHGGPADPKTHKKAQELLRSRKDMDVRRGRGMMVGSVDTILMHQDIKIYAAEIDGRPVSQQELQEAQATGRVMPVHHRNGYHRMQPYGPHSMYRKRIFIQPVWVNIKRYSGPAIDPSQTSVTYTLKSKPPQEEAQ